jgi:hypothetical protein
MFKRLFILVLTLVMCLSLAGCRKPYDKPEFVKISPSQTGFLIPLIGDSTTQSAFESEDLLAEHKVATKEIQIPHRWVQTGRMHWMGEWKPSAELIVVERKPVSRSWESGDSAASSANRAIFAGSSDNIGIYVGMNCTAMIEEADAVKFLYRYNNTPLESIIDTDIKKMVEDRFNIETSKYTSTELGANKGKIMEAVKEYVIPYFKNYGITITVLGLKEDISYENPAIQDAIDKRFASEQDLAIQKNKNEANIAKAEAEAQAMIMLAEAEAKANDLLSQSLNGNLLEKMYYEKWDGKLPTIYGGDGMTPIVQVP